MTHIKIRNFGPIKAGYEENDGWLEISKVTLFTGNQGAGKSTVAKLISTFSWIEKALTRGDYEPKHFEKSSNFMERLQYHRIDNYFHFGNDKEATLLDYKGESFCFRYENGMLHIEESKSLNYPLPQIMYVPAERNFISNVKEATALRLTSDALVEFVTEYNRALDEIKGLLDIPINDVKVEYNRQLDRVYIKGEDYTINLTEASSGFQSLVPLYLVSRFLSGSVKAQGDSNKEQMTPDQRERFRKGIEALSRDANLTEEQRRILISEEAKKFNKSAFINIVEEAEQNLYPTSQWAMLKSLIAFNNLSTGNKLVMTTHSPYLINYLTIAVKAFLLYGKITSIENTKRVEEIVSSRSTVRPSDLSIYEMDGRSGTIKRLPKMYDLPSDSNQLNEELSESNELYSRLLEIQQSL